MHIVYNIYIYYTQYYPQKIWLTDESHGPNLRSDLRPTIWLTDRPTDGPTDRPTDRLTDRPTDHFTDRPTDGLTDGRINRPTDRLTDRQSDCASSHLPLTVLWHQRTARSAGTSATNSRRPSGRPPPIPSLCSIISPRLVDTNLSTKLYKYFQRYKCLEIVWTASDF